VFDLIVDGGDGPPTVGDTILEANNVLSLQTRLPNVWSDSVVHSNTQWAPEVAGSCTTHQGRKWTGSTVSGFCIFRNLL